MQSTMDFYLKTYGTPGLLCFKQLRKVILPEQENFFENCGPKTLFMNCSKLFVGYFQKQSSADILQNRCS